MKRLAILSTHPIQYNAPLYRMLHEDEDIHLHVFFSKTWEQVKFDPDFQRDVVWDIPVSVGYAHSTHDASSKPGKDELERAIRDYHPEAILVYGWNFPGHLAMMRRFHGAVPIWFRGDSHLLNPKPLWKRVMRRFALSRIYRHVDTAFPVGKANREYYLWSGMKPAQLIDAPHAVDIQFWTRDHTARVRKAKAWKSELNIPQSSIVIGYAGKLEPLKQVALLIAAATKTPQIHLVIAGSGALETELKEQAKATDRIHFLGFVNQSEMPIFYRMVDIIALVSLTETWGLCINEAMACGARCLLSDRVGCHPDVLTVPQRGTKVSWNQPNSWPGAIETLLRLPPRTAAEIESFNSHFNLQHLHHALKTAFRQ